MFEELEDDTEIEDEDCFKESYVLSSSFSKIALNKMSVRRH